MHKSFIYQLLVIFLLSISNLLSVSAQEMEEDTLSPEQRYALNIKKDYINNIYIPQDIYDCFIQLTKLSDSQALGKFKSASEAEVSTKLHFGLGRWMQHNWNLYEGSRLSHYLKEMGVSYPDDMVQFIIVSYHKYLNKKPLELKKRAALFREKRLKEVRSKLDTIQQYTQKKEGKN